ncbi:MAG: heme-degrading monooxygenase HmoA [Bacteroidia bacterium]|jgi:heme-degrading monooxygenase HmoA
MYAVIFRATVANMDDDYIVTAQRMRELALSRFGCVEFVSAHEGDQELAISYWESEEEIIAWRQHPEHLEAQAKGREFWYTDYSVEVAEVQRAYGSNSLTDEQAGAVH